MRQASAFSVLGVFFVASCILLVSLLVSPVGAQSTVDDPLAGTDVTLEDTNNDQEVANRVLIPLTNCDVAENASVTVRNVDEIGEPTGSPIELVNGRQDVQIAQDPTEIVIENAAQEDLDQGLASGVGEVVESTGFTCGAGTDTNTERTDDEAGSDGADDQQYGDDAGDINDPDGVMNDTVPDKPLPKTGGLPVIVGAGLMLAAATVLGSRVIGRR